MYLYSIDNYIFICIMYIKYQPIWETYIFNTFKLLYNTIQKLNYNI